MLGVHAVEASVASEVYMQYACAGTMWVRRATHRLSVSPACPYRRRPPAHRRDACPVLAP